jgi:cytidylate kinase
VAKALAQKMGFTHVNTGSLYRAVAYALRTSGASLDPVDPSDLAKISLEYTNSGILLNGADPGEALRSPESAAGASCVAKQPLVREFLLEVQRRSADDKWIVMEGRDIGTVIFPDALVKIFLTASSEERARRRMAQGEVPAGASLEDVKRDIEARDLQDSTRAVAPLKAAEDAVTVDCSSLTLEETIEAIARIVEAKRKERA